MKKLLALIVAVQAAPALTVAAPAAITLYVSPNGNDAWSGTPAKANKAKNDGPLATPQGARDAMRRLKANGLTGGVTVEFAAGTYLLAAPLKLEAQDSGTEQAPIVYRAAKGAIVKISGGRAIGGFMPVADTAILDQLPAVARNQVVQSDLKAQGIDDFGKLARRGFGKAIVPSHLELFWNDQPMTLARWPNAGEAMPYTRIAALPGGQDGLTFGVGDDLAVRLDKWQKEKDPWLFGYWFHDWADEYVPVATIDSAGKTLTLQTPKPNYGMKLKQRFYGLNLLSELDSPGEWYLDRDSGKLYFWPPAKNGQAYVSLAPQLFDLQNVSDVTLRGFTIEGTRSTAVRVTNGTRAKIVACTLRNLGNGAISITGGNDCGVVGNDIYNCGDGGVSLSGGDRKTLTPCGHYAENNQIYNYSRWSRTYRPAIGIGGDGVRASHNLLYDGPHNAIQLGGNDHLIEFNEIHSVAYDTGDVGAFYMGRDWTARGTIIRNNYFHHIKGPGTYGAMGVYLDDQASGISITGNIFYDVTRAAFIGGGDDNLVDNNIFVNCVPSVHIDARGMGWQKKATDDPEGELRRYLRNMPYQNELWSKRYPQLVNILEDDPNAPKRNLVQRNIAIGGKWDDVEKKGAQWQIFKDNYVTAEAETVAKIVKSLPANPRPKDFAPLNKLPQAPPGFEPLPLTQIGLQKSDDRASWPVVSTPRVAPQDEGAVVKAVPTAAGAAPIFKVAKAQAVPVIDGAINAAEWNGANAQRALLMEQDMNGAKATPTSLAWILQSEAGLWIAIDNATDPNATLRKGDAWGEDDAVEIAIRREDMNRVANVYRGFPSGHWLVSDENGLPKDVMATSKVGVKYATRAVEQGRWSAEWFIPWQALGLNKAPTVGTRFAFNLTARKPAGDLWLMWRGTGGNSFLVERAGLLEITP